MILLHPNIYWKVFSILSTVNELVIFILQLCYPTPLYPLKYIIKRPLLYAQ
jgi:hypothetical protein